MVNVDNIKTACLSNCKIIPSLKDGTRSKFQIEISLTWSWMLCGTVNPKSNNRITFENFPYLMSTCRNFRINSSISSLTNLANDAIINYRLTVLYGISIDMFITNHIFLLSFSFSQNPHLIIKRMKTIQV